MKTYLILSFLFAYQIFSATYYVSTTGSDSYTALQARNMATPWQTLSKVSSTAFTAGDTVLFKRGDSWTGTLRITSSGTSGNQLVFSSYGSGASPVINGTRTVTGNWSVHSGNTYVADFSMPSVALFMDGKPMILARHPNSGYITIDTVLDSFTMRSNAANSVNWTDARAHIRTEHWTIASKTITNCIVSPLTITLNAIPVYSLRSKWGFFINNALAALDTAGEWYHDAAAGKIYFRMPDNSSPAGHKIEMSVDSFGIVLYRNSYVTINGFTLFGHRESAISVPGASGSGIRITGNTILYPDKKGIQVFETPSNYLIADNTIIGANTYGIHTTYGSNAVVEGNTIKSIATIPRLTASGMSDNCCSGVALEVSGPNLTVRRNRIDSIGYIGLRNGYGAALIEQNYITNCCISKDDGGGIYTGWQIDTTASGVAGTVIRKNVIMNTRSSNDGTPNKGYHPGQGIYIDDYGHDITIEGNTTAFCVDNGIFLHNTRRIKVRDNTMFDNRNYQARYAENDYPDKPIPMADNFMYNNRMVSLSSEQIPFGANSTFAVSSNFGIWDTNTYWNPFNKAVINYRNTPYTLSEWQQNMGQDGASKISHVYWNPWILKKVVSTEMIINGAFDINSSGWSIWPGGTCTVSRDSGHGLDGGCLKVVSPWDGSRQPIIVSNSFALKKDHKYLLKFSVVSAYAGQILPVVRQSNNPWSTVAKTLWLPMGRDRENHEVLFTPTVNDSPCRIDFNPSHNDSLFWLDNVSLVEVEADTFNSSSRIFLLCNTSYYDSTIYLPSGLKTLSGAPAPAVVTLQPFTSEVYYSDSSRLITGTADNQRIKAVDSYRAVPNPFNPTVKLSLPIEAKNITSIQVFDIKGRLVADLTKALFANTILWSPDKSVASGLLIVRFSSGITVEKELKITLVR
ncbi:MAG: right-handed parallel beta-helix repeat-containing protein [Fibrobacteres bacterium]|nr:right-handed parallel beta-helix repeat-containing protein [Fibrobacterota bacterium]